MTLTKIDDLINASASGNTFKASWTKQSYQVAALVAGIWYDFSQFYGSPTAETFAGTALTATQCIGPGTTNGINGATATYIPNCLPTGGNVSPATKIIVGIDALTSAATGAPGWLLLVDMLMYYPGINMNINTQQTLINNVALPRYTSGNGVMMYLVANNSIGSAASNIHPYGFNYTNSYGVAGKVLPFTVTCMASALSSQIVHSNVTATNTYGPFLPLAGGDQGVRSVQSFQITAATNVVSTATLVLCRPIAQIPISTVHVASSRDFIFNMPSTQRIYDGAYLNFLFLAGGAVAKNTNFFATLNFMWG